MNRELKIALANALIKLVDQTAGKKGNIKMGICTNVARILKKDFKLGRDEIWDCDEWISSQCEQWPKFSGNWSYPVPAPHDYVFEIEKKKTENSGFDIHRMDEENRAHQFFHEGEDYKHFWGYNKYGILRRELLAFLLERISKQL